MTLTSVEARMSDVNYGHAGHFVQRHIKVSVMSANPYPGMYLSYSAICCQDMHIITGPSKQQMLEANISNCGVIMKYLKKTK